MKEASFALTQSLKIRSFVHSLYNIDNVIRSHKVNTKVPLIYIVEPLDHMCCKISLLYLHVHHVSIEQWYGRHVVCPHNTACELSSAWRKAWSGSDSIFTTSFRLYFCYCAVKWYYQFKFYVLWSMEAIPNKLYLCLWIRDSR